MKTIKLTQGRETIVDDEDFEELNKYKWHTDGNGYVKRIISIKIGSIHQIINNTPPGFETDHINGNKLDNRRTNLRTVTRSQNMQNQKIAIDNTSGYKGVQQRKTGKYEAKIVHNYKQIYLGTFKSAEEAAGAYNRKALELFGEYARLNEIKKV